jgi:membrane protease YdiL (CAAX protease family)
MEKTGFPKKKGDNDPLDKLKIGAESIEPSGPPKIAGFSRRIFAVIKFTLGICLLPVVYSSTVSFLNEFLLIEKTLQNYFWSGVISLLIIYLFVWEPNIIYIKGQKLLEVIFTFFKPLIRVAPYVLPIYTIILFVLYGPLSLIFSAKGGSAGGAKSGALINYFIFLFGLSITLHLIFSAKSIRSKQGDFLKSNYIFGFSLIYIIDLTLLVFILSLIFQKFSFVNFCNISFQTSKAIFEAVFKQLFL